jgi:hypothetical protein
MTYHQSTSRVHSADTSNVTLAQELCKTHLKTLRKNAVTFNILTCVVLFMHTPNFETWTTCNAIFDITMLIIFRLK